MTENSSADAAHSRQAGFVRCCLKEMVGEVLENGLEAELDGELGYGRQKDVLGMCIGENESAKYWLQILNGLKNHGDILITCIDGLTGFPEAISAVYPKTEYSSA